MCVLLRNTNTVRPGHHFTQLSWQVIPTNLQAYIFITVCMGNIFLILCSRSQYAWGK